MKDFNERYIAARRAVIAQDLKRLNPMQRNAAMTTEGPLLLLAGAAALAERVEEICGLVM